MSSRFTPAVRRRATAASSASQCLPSITACPREETDARSVTRNVSPQRAIARTRSRIRGTCDDMARIVLRERVERRSNIFDREGWRG